jgi:hypothetical protein
MATAQQQGWEVLLDVGIEFPTGWCLVGGQMVWLHAVEQGVEPPRATEDVDVVVGVPAARGAIRRLCKWLEERGFSLEGMNARGIGHRYVRAPSGAPGRVVFDVLAPDRLGTRADLTTTPPARTVAAPGARAALNRAEPVDVMVGARTGRVLRPTLLAAILAKAAATTITVRSVPERDWADAAFLLTLVADPMAAAAQLTRTERRRLQRIDPLLDQMHSAWRPLGSRARLGHAALRFLLEA